MTNNQFTDKHLASLAAIMLLAPAVGFMLKEKSIDVTSEEESYVRSYIRYGYYVLLVLALALIVWSAYSFFFPLTVLYRINYGLLGIVIAMIVMGVFSIINNKTLIDRTTNNTEMRSNAAVITYFIPLYNYYLWYNETLDEHSRRWVKESVLWRSLYLIIISIRPTATTIFFGLFLILARCIMVTVGLDMLSLHAKNSINRWFYRNIEELIAYPLGIVLNAIKALFGKSQGLHNELESRKLTYSHLDKVANARTLISYLLALSAIGYRGYVTWLSSGPTVGVSLALLPQIIRVGKTLMTLPSGTLPRIPLVYTLLGGKKEKVTPPTEITNNTTNTNPPIHI